MIPNRPHGPRRPRQNPHKPPHNLAGFIKFTAIAVLMMVGFDYVAFNGERPYITKIKQEYYAKQHAKEQAFEEALPPEVNFSEADISQIQGINEVEPSLFPTKYLNITKLLSPDKEENIPPDIIATPKIKLTNQTPQVGKHPKIALVIDDVGMNIKQSNRAIALPAKTTIAMLPYAPKARSLARQAKKQGHELIIHTPMEALSGNAGSLGAMALRSDMTPAVFKAEFNKMANSFEGYVGVNNHMGSRLTQDDKAMNMLMEELSKRGLFFLDSKTINTSIAADTAKRHLIPHATRDVFLDHEDTPQYVSEALQRVERIAKLSGSVIAIGHPKMNTMNALEAWIPQAQARGFEFVAISHLVRHPKQRHHRVKESHVQQTDDNKKVIVVNVEPTAPVAAKVELPKVSYPVE